MLEKLIIIYSFLLTLNPANKLCTWANSNFNAQITTGKETTGERAIVSDGDMATWQPLIQTKNWLAPPPNHYTSSALTSTATPLLQSSSLRIKLAGQINTPKQQQYLNHHQHQQQTNDFLPYNHKNGNYSKFHQTTSPASLVSLSSMNKKMKPSYTNKHQRQNTPHTHQFKLKHIESLYPTIPNNITSQVQQPSHSTYTKTSNFPHNFHNHVAADVNEREQQPKLQYRNIISTPKIDNSNVPDKPTDTILIKVLNSFVTNENLIDSKIKNSATLHRRKDEYRHSDDFNIVNLNDNLLLLQKTFDNVMEFYDNVKDIIFSDNDDAHETYSNEDEIEVDNDLTNINYAIAEATAETATEKIPSLNIKKTTTLSSPSIGEVQGRKRQIDKGIITKYSLISSLPAASSSISTTQHSETHNVQAAAATSAEITARGLTWNTAKAKDASASSTPAHTTSSSLSTFGTGRKIKKKFGKFLLPLLLAYKLKFLALIPLLMGGLTLLVGTTGLAGFFFALFTAVMSLKSVGKSAIVVKKY